MELAVIITLIVIFTVAVIAIIIFFSAKISGLKKEYIDNLNRIADYSAQKNAEAVKEANNDSLAHLLAPLKMRLEDFNRVIVESNSETKATRVTLGDQIDRLVRLNISVGEDARKLAAALRGNTTYLGRWGEAVLENILQKAGLSEGFGYISQASLDSEGNRLVNPEGKSIRPDFLINLPGERVVVIDSKASLSNYLKYTEAATEAEMAENLSRHVISIKRHIDELSRKRYASTIKGSLQQVLMFIPNDHALLTAIKSDPDLYEYAYNRNISLVSPVFIVPVLQLVNQMWLNENQDRNRMEIAKLGGLLYESVVAFTSELEGIRKGLDVARIAYDRALDKLSNGSRSVTARAERLRTLGIKTSRTISEKILGDNTVTDIAPEKYDSDIRNI